MNESKLIFEHHSCPRCNGRLSLEKDHVSMYEECIFCGYTHDLEPITKAEVKDWTAIKGKYKNFEAVE
jgi:hypothetical protein